MLKNAPLEAMKKVRRWFSMAVLAYLAVFNLLLLLRVVSTGGNAIPVHMLVVVLIQLVLSLLPASLAQRKKYLGVLVLYLLAALVSMGVLNIQSNTWYYVLFVIYAAGSSLYTLFARDREPADESGDAGDAGESDGNS